MKFALKKMPKKPEQRVMGDNSKPQVLTSAYDFLSSPPHQEPFRDTKSSQSKCKKKPRKKTLKDIINQQWERQKEIAEGGKKSSDETKEKNVSFCSQPLVIPGPDPNRTSGHRTVIDPKRTQSDSDGDPSVGAFIKPTEKSSNDSLSVSCSVAVESLSSEECLLSGGEMSLLKRGRQQTSSPTSLSKRSRRKGQSRSRDSFSSDVGPRQALEESFGKTSPRSSPSTSTASTVSLLRNFKRANTQILDTKLPPVSNNTSQKEAEKMVSFSKKSPNNPSTKRNHKGETLLHIASIEVGQIFCSRQKT